MRWPPLPTRSGASGPCNSIPRCTTRRWGRNSSGTSLNICGARGDWTPAHFIETTVAAIREKVGKGHVICGLSGGVDSSVAAMLVHRAIGSQLTCIFVNNGVLRKNEFQSVQANLRGKLGLNIVAVNASARFLEQARRSHRPRDQAQAHRRGVHCGLRGRGEPHRAGDGRPDGKLDWLVQGTLYPDVIESTSVKGPEPDHQEPPQRGRIARADEAQIDRAAARPLQG